MMLDKVRAGDHIERNQVNINDCSALGQAVPANLKELSQCL